MRFTVQAYPNQTFTGTVRQVRLQSTTTDNVVNYTVVVSVDNPKGTLLPGMTATVEFLTGSAENVLIVPNAALRFRADAGDDGGGGRADATGAPRTAADSVAFAARRDSLRGHARRPAAPAVVRRRGGQVAQRADRRVPRVVAMGGGAPRRRWRGAVVRARDRSGGRRRVRPALVRRTPNGKPAVMRVRTGLSDGQNTQVIGPDVKEGMQVIIGSAAATTTTPRRDLDQSVPAAASAQALAAREGSDHA